MKILKLALVVALANGCALWKARNMKKPGIDLRTVQVQSVDAKGAVVLFGVEIDNPNSFPLKVDAITYNAEVGGQKLAAGKLDDPPEAKANAQTIVPLPVRFEFQDLLNSLSMFLSNDKTPYRIQGAAQIGSFSVPFDEAGEFRMKTGFEKRIEKDSK